MNDAASIQVVLTARLIKWDGEPQQVEHPEGHPNCKEIIDIDADGNQRLIFRRATDE